MSILIVYSTLTENTKRVAENLYKNLKEGLSEHSFELKSIESLSPDSFKKYDLILLGASTTGDGELNYDAQDFFSRVEGESADFTGNTFALFGLGDKLYQVFCAAIDTIQEKIKSHNGTVLPDIIKIDGYPTEDTLAQTVTWAKKIIASQTNGR